MIFTKKRVFSPTRNSPNGELRVVFFLFANTKMSDLLHKKSDELIDNTICKVYNVIVKVYVQMRRFL